MIAEFFSDLFAGGAGAATAIAPRVFRNASLENPAYGLNDPRLAPFWGGGSTSDSGIVVSHQSSLSQASVWGSVDMVSGDVAKLPLDVFKRLPNDDREVALDHEAEFIVSAEPNEEMCAFEFWKRVMAHAMLWQNAYSWVSRQGGSPRGKLLGLYNLLPDRTKPVRLPNGDLAYQTEVDGKQEVLMAWEVMHIKGLCIENEAACDLVSKMRDTIGLALAAQGYNSTFFANGAQSAGTLTVPAGTSEPAVQKLEEGLKARTGKDNWFKLMILREGAQFHATTIDAQKSQTHELREDQVRDLARFFRIPPAKLGLSDSVSYSSAEQAQLDYLGSCISHWLAAIVGESQRKLLTEQQRRTFSHYMAHNVSKLIEIDVKTLNEVLAIQRQNEVINANEWRRKIDLNARKDPGGEEYVNPSTKSAQLAREATGGSGDDPKKTDRARNTLNAMRPVLADAFRRATSRVTFAARRESKRLSSFVRFVDTLGDEHDKAFDSILSPAIDAIALMSPAISHSDGMLHLSLSESLLCEARMGLHCAFLGKFKPLASNPADPAQLQELVEHTCRVLEAEIPSQLANKLIGGLPCQIAA